MTDPAPRAQVAAVLTSVSRSAAGQHRYLSTACLHQRCADCRKTCKFCDATCLCDCHEDTAEG